MLTLLRLLLIVTATAAMAVASVLACLARQSYSLCQSRRVGEGVAVRAPLAPLGPDLQRQRGSGRECHRPAGQLQARQAAAARLKHSWPCNLAARSLALAARACAARACARVVVGWHAMTAVALRIGPAVVLVVLVVLVVEELVQLGAQARGEGSITAGRKD